MEIKHFTVALLDAPHCLAQGFKQYVNCCCQTKYSFAAWEL